VVKSTARTAFVFVVLLPLTPALSLRRGSRFVGFSESEFNSISESEFNSVFHVGVTLPNTSISPLSLWERARVRGFSACEFDSVCHVDVALPNATVSPLSLWERARVRGFSAWNSTRYCMSAYVLRRFPARGAKADARLTRCLKS
jgi:hypothetical protein